MSNFDTLTAQSTVQRDRFKRASQRDVLPTAVKSRNLGNIVYGTDTSIASTSIGNGQEVYVTSSIAQNDEFELQGHVYLSMYVGTVAVANLLPGGSAIDESQWQIIGPHYEFYKWSDSNFARHREYVTIYVRNISAGTVTLTFYFKWHYVSPREGA